MTHTEMITLFKDLSGRHNLKDSQVTMFLNSGGKFLQPKLYGHVGDVIHFAGVETGENFIDLTKYFYSVKEIYLIGTEVSANREYVRVIPYPDMPSFLKDNPNHDQEGLPTSWVVVPPVGMADFQDITTSFRSHERWAADKFGSGNPTVVLFNTRMQSRTELRIIGQAALRDLVNPDDANYLTTQFPFLLYHAALYFLELFQKQYVEANSLLGTISGMIDSQNVASIAVQANLMPNEIA